MNSIRIYKKIFPKRKIIILEKEFQYRYFKNNDSNKTVIMLSGGIGISDFLFTYFEELSKNYSVIIFDYPEGYDDIQEVAYATSKLLYTLGIKGILIGNILDGFIAQIMAANYPDIVEGLILINTGSLSEEFLSEDKLEYHRLVKKLENHIDKSKLIPFSIVKKSIKKVIISKVTGRVSYKEEVYINEMLRGVMENFTKPNILQLTNLFYSVINNINLRKENFEYLDKKTLLILSNDIETYSDKNKESLIKMMSNPEVETNIGDGYLSLITKKDEYMKIIRNFISKL